LGPILYPPGQAKISLFFLKKLKPGLFLFDKNIFEVAQQSKHSKKSFYNPLLFFSAVSGSAGLLTAKYQASDWVTP